ncbi:MAG: aspartate/glutamate racemase family protein [Paracoccaceae bacterium]|nr:aspartate/glutamate racemase family protein [Paracoccaceae bacterium]
MGPIVVINPNSNQAVTDGLDAALDAYRLGPAIECLTLAEGPFGIESDAHVAQVIDPLVHMVQSRPDAAAFVLACYSDPGLAECRAAVSQPVFGIQESGTLTAMTRGARFGVIAIAEASVARHRRYIERMGVLDRLVAELPLGMSVDETARGADTFERLVETGSALVEQGSDSVILGCAGMAKHRAPLEAALGKPVIEPTQAAVVMALGAVLA